ncbi:hypothetical protein IEQ34_021296 [Dendrobium chrysotoxum]|uniref:Putative plant transposon protein domain-containing protein n=1 Tax=Dendrobium chrysotoxum TaxID=161865 RepID=A0AAV7G4Q7_DENCH|nr:hypothetical protein IEQ34_021296 [Dendrobium chrysotoxum]
MKGPDHAGWKIIRSLTKVRIKGLEAIRGFGESSKGWEHFCEKPYTTIVNVVREYFANRKEAAENKCYVRGKWVPFDYVTINNLYKHKNFKFDEYPSFCWTPIDLEDILRVLCGPNTCLLFTRNTSEVTWDRALLNYSIQIGGGDDEEGGLSEPRSSSILDSNSDSMSSRTPKSLGEHVTYLRFQMDGVLDFCDDAKEWWDEMKMRVAHYMDHKEKSFHYTYEFNNALVGKARKVEREREEFDIFGVFPFSKGGRNSNY